MLKKFDDTKTIISMENTGRYNWALYDVLADLNFTVFVIAPLQLKRSMGMVRGKNDKVDSYRIATYTVRYFDELKPWIPEAKEIKLLRLFLSERRQMVLTW